MLARYMAVSLTGLPFTRKQWRKFFFGSQYRQNVAGFNEIGSSHLKPGGWFEQTEMSVVIKSDDGTVKPDSIFAKWGRVSLEAGDAFGKGLRTVDEAKQNITNAGFEEVREHRYKLPLGGEFFFFRKQKVVSLGTRLIHGNNRLAQRQATERDWRV
jgi:hypothetical protein